MGWGSNSSNTKHDQKVVRHKNTLADKGRSGQARFREDLGRFSYVDRRLHKGSEDLQKGAMLAAGLQAMEEGTEFVSLRFKVRDLKNYDKDSLTDCFIVVYQLHNETKKKEYVGMTEVQVDTLDPTFVEEVVL